VETRLSGIVHANLPACPIGGVSSDLTRLAWLSVKTSVFAACLATMKNEPDAISMTRNVMRTLRSVIPIGPKRKPNYMWAVLAA
jgi:hypothetical protein